MRSYPRYFDLNYEKPRTRKQKVKLLDYLWATKVKEIFNKTCMWCGGHKVLSADHIFTSSHYATRWNLMNGIALCAGCHIFKKRRAPMEWSLIVLDHLPLKEAKALRKLHKSKVEIDLDQKIIELSKKGEDYIEEIQHA